MGLIAAGGGTLDVVFHALGFAGQAFFTLRILTQWIASERAGKSVVPTSYWWISTVGSLLLLVYAWYKGDPIFLVGPLVNLILYVRNLFLAKPKERKPTSRRYLIPLLVVLALACVVALYASVRQKKLLELTESPVWMAIGLAGMTLWAARYIVQWWFSERAGRAVLPASFFWISTVGAILLFSYAVYRVDWVFMLAYALNPIPYVRNLILIYRPREKVTAAAAEAGE